MALKPKKRDALADALGIPKPYQRDDDFGADSSPEEEQAEGPNLDHIEELVNQAQDILDQIKAAIQSSHTEENGENESQTEY